MFLKSTLCAFLTYYLIITATKVIEMMIKKLNMIVHPSIYRSTFSY